MFTALKSLFRPAQTGGFVADALAAPLDPPAPAKLPISEVFGLAHLSDDALEGLANACLSEACTRDFVVRSDEFYSFPPVPHRVRFTKAVKGV